MSLPSAPCPPRFREHVFEYACTINRSMTSTWQWLLRPETFTQGQLWPWRVEFLETPQEDGSTACGFDIGTLNAHHGPLMNFCGVITRIEEGDQICERDLEYGYGAYAIGFRFIRPRLLTIRVSKLDDAKCEVVIRVTSHVRHGWSRLWTMMQRCFWPMFRLAARRGVPRS